MVSPEKFRTLCLSFEGAEELPHHDKTSFRINGKIFATMRESEMRATVFFSPADKALFCYPPTDIIYPVPNKWGEYGWTHLNLKKITQSLAKEAVKAAYTFVSTKKIKGKQAGKGPDLYTQRDSYPTPAGFIKDSLKDSVSVRLRPPGRKNDKT